MLYRRPEAVVEPSTASSATAAKNVLELDLDLEGRSSAMLSLSPGYSFLLKTFFAKKISRSQEFFSISLPRSKIHIQKKSQSFETERSLESVTRVPICFHDTRSLDEIENCRLRRRQQQPQKFEVDQSVVVVAVVDVVFLSLGKVEIVQNKASVKNICL